MEKHRDKHVRGIFIRPISLLIIIITAIFASSTLVNLALSVFSPLSLDIKLTLMDAGLMVIILFPLMYYLVYEPLTSYIKALNSSEEALQESEAKFRSLVETTDDSIYLVNRNCEYLFMNAKYRSRRYLVFNEEYKGKTYGDFHTTEETRVFSEKVNRVFVTGTSLQQEYRSADGRYFLRTLSPIKGPGNEVAAVSVVSKDITGLAKKGEIELRYRAIFEQSPFGILIIDTGGKIIEFNEAACTELGYSREEFAKLRLFDINPQSKEEIQDRIREVLSRGSYAFNVKHRTKSGEFRDVHVVARVLDLFGYKVIQAIWQDVTEQKRREEALLK
jgi:PAS domain S-box-containing protein